MIYGTLGNSGTNGRMQISVAVRWIVFAIWYSQPLHAVIGGEKGARVWTSLSGSDTTISLTCSYVNNRAQHYECFPGETLWNCAPLSPYLSGIASPLSVAVRFALRLPVSPFQTTINTFHFESGRTTRGVHYFCSSRSLPLDTAVLNANVSMLTFFKWQR